MLDKILKYIEDNYYYEVDEENGTRLGKIVDYEELKEFIEKLKECERNEL